MAKTPESLTALLVCPARATATAIASASATCSSLTRTRSTSTPIVSGLRGLARGTCTSACSCGGDAQQLYCRWLQQDGAQIAQPGTGAVLPANTLLTERLEGVQVGKHQLVLQGGAARWSGQRDEQPRLQSLPSRGLDFLPEQGQSPLPIDRFDAVRKARDVHGTPPPPLPTAVAPSTNPDGRLYGKCTGGVAGLYPAPAI